MLRTGRTRLSRDRRGRLTRRSTFPTLERLMSWLTTSVTNNPWRWPLIGVKIRLLIRQSSSTRLCAIWHRPPGGLINLRDCFDNTGKIFVGQQGEEIRLGLLSRDVKLLSQSRSDNVTTGCLGVTGGFCNRGQFFGITKSFVFVEVLDSSATIIWYPLYQWLDGGALCTLESFNPLL